jgi:NADH-quinone oxidoreductase subunit N
VGNYALLIPEGLLIVGALIALFAEYLPGGDRGAARMGAALAAGAGVVALILPADSVTLFTGQLAFDGPARFTRVGVAFLGAVWLLWTVGRSEGRVRDAVSLSLFAMVGCMLMAEARELITLLLAIELASLPAYVLVGYRREDSRGLEGALKYFLLSMLTTLVTMYGFSFIFGLTGTTSYGAIDLTHAGTLGLVAVVLSLIGLFAKLSAAPFHFWAPDACEGSTAWAVAFVSTVPKLAGAVAVARFVDAVVPPTHGAGVVIALVATISMMLGNLAALTQTDLRRMMAYSGVSHAGYLLVGVTLFTHTGFSAAILYALAYAIPSLGIMLVIAEEGPRIDDLGGLAARRPATAWGLVVLLLSLIGVPPMIGFFGKFNIILAALEAELTPLVIVLVVMSVVSAGYYLRIVRSVFFAEELATARARRPSRSASVAFGLSVVATVAAGIGAGWIASLVGAFIR